MTQDITIVETDDGKEIIRLNLNEYIEKEMYIIRVALNRRAIYTAFGRFGRAIAKYEVDFCGCRSD